MNRRAKLGILGAVVLLGAVTSVFVMLSVMPEPAPAFQPSESNTAVHAALLEAGVTDAVVDVTPERVLIRYSVPEGMGVNESIVVVLVQTALTDAESDVLVVQVYEAQTPIYQLTVDRSVVAAYAIGDIAPQELWRAMEVQPAT